MSVSDFKENLYKSLGLGVMATAVAFVGLDVSVGNAVGGAVSRVLPASLVNPVALGGIVFAIGLVYTNFLDDKIEDFFRKIY
jgi:ABC-type Fe3+ transport system permease subunit